MADFDPSWTYEDLDVFDDAVDAFIEGVDRHLVRVSYRPSRGEAEVRLFRTGGQQPDEVWRVVSPALQELSALIADRYRTDGHFDVVRGHVVWSMVYGPCLYYGGNARRFADVVREQTETIRRLPAGWEPMTVEEIRKMMTED